MPVILYLELIQWRCSGCGRKIKVGSKSLTLALTPISWAGQSQPCLFQFQRKGSARLSLEGAAHHFFGFEIALIRPLNLEEEACLCFWNAVMKAKMMKHNIPKLMIPPMQINNIPSFWWPIINFFNRAFINLNSILWKIFLQNFQTTLFIVFLKTQSSYFWHYLILLGCDALRNSIEKHLQWLTLGLAPARLDLNASLRANPGEQEIISSGQH